MSNDDILQLEDYANKATKGHWFAVGTWVENENDTLPEIVCTPHDFDRGPKDSEKQREADAKYIAAAQPTVIKKLIAEVRYLRGLFATSSGAPNEEN